ncbi:hypothetical protein [Corynebacterium accolens]|uniref:hypothetical protein n=1 Tax=Corynebacterium accolens TaxID=38284 RepID=UPI00254C176E|nr:hypothetical protein [Corynebacterium accolens]MDK8472404.1 hypothetical protein [Corynebacterium accolens]MDK8618479.1 hypothetical protein [Corynebacterium accolens]
MPVPYFVADSAQVTVLRSLASTAFGKYNLTLPEGVDLEDVYEVAAPGNELAYVSSLGPRKRVGGMFRRFVRADVDITAKGEGATPASNVERVLDEAAQRTSGDFFLESDISLAGLGPWRPFEDFVVGDVANVEIWGRVVQLRVTRIEPKRTEHSDTDWSVHVGGQLVSDADARLAENADIYKAVVDDRRDLAGLDAKIQAETSSRKEAISAESSARRADVESVRGVLTGGGEHQRDLLASLEGLNKQLRRNGEEPAPGLIPAYLQMNTQLWQAQQEINEALRKADEAQSALVASNAEHLAELEEVNESRGQVLNELRSQERELRAQRVRWFGLKQRSDEFWSYSGSTLTAKGSWVGEAVVFVTYSTEVHTGATSSPRRTEIEHTSTDYMDIGSTRSMNLNPNERGVTLTTKGAVMYRVAPGETRELSMTRHGFSPSAASWTQVDAFNAQSTAEYVFQPRVVWDAVHRGARYQFRVTVDGVAVLSDDSGTDFGPLFPWGDGRRERVASARRRRINAGQRVRFEVWTDAPEVSSRRVDSAVCRVSWIED